MSLYDPKTAYALCVGLAGCIRSTVALLNAVDLLGKSVNASAVDPASPFPAGLELDGTGGLLVLAAELSVVAERLAEGSGKVQRLRSKLLRVNADDVSRETSVAQVNRQSSEDDC